MDCAAARALLHAAVDGELDAANALRVDQHLAGCVDCANEHAALLALRTAVRENATRHAAPDALRAALTATLGAIAEKPATIVPFTPRRPLRAWWRPGLAGFATGAALAASVALVVKRATLPDTAMDSVIAAHIRALQPGHLTDVQVSDRHQVKPWFDGKVDFAPPVKDLSDQGFDLVGGRLDYVNGEASAAIVYRRRLHLIDVFVAKSTADERTEPRAAASRGYNVEHWTADGEDYWAVSDINSGELAEFARVWQRR
jgi:anti-sigma factor RsiW